jgi:hypothetical protein
MIIIHGVLSASIDHENIDAVQSKTILGINDEN